MATRIFVNLPVKNLDASIEFFNQLGFTFDPRFTDETATCLIVGESIFVMLLTEEKFQSFTPKPICDATQSTEVLVCLTRESRAEVDLDPIELHPRLAQRDMVGQAAGPRGEIEPHGTAPASMWTSSQM